MPSALRFAVSGIGRRSVTTYLPLFASHEVANQIELAAVVDVDPRRLQALAEGWPKPVPAYRAADFDRMLRELAPDWVIIASPDHAHCGQICAALERNVSVITEKPMVLNAMQARAVLATSRRSSAHVKVAHNLRYLNLTQLIKAILDEGHIGTVTSAVFAYHLAPEHGGSYFRRWHRRRAASGGLSVTKSCHHFDLFNWWLDDTPVEVSGWIARHHFLPGTALPGDPAMDVPPDADIEDTIAARIAYKRGALVSYTLNACSSWEGFDVRIHGTNGSLMSIYGKLSCGNHSLTMRLRDGAVRRFSIPREEGRHSGADRRMLNSTFGLLAAGEMPFMSLPDARDGALAVAIGDGIYRSALGRRPVMLEENASAATAGAEAGLAS